MVYMYLYANCYNVHVPMSVVDSLYQVTGVFPPTAGDEGAGEEGGLPV